MTLSASRSWKDADPDIPILKQAKAEHTKPGIRERLRELGGRLEPAESCFPAVTVRQPLRSRHRIPLNFSLYVSIQIASFAPGKTDNRRGDH